MQPRRIWQIGIVVADVAAAKAELEEALHLQFREPVTYGFHDWRTRIALARQGPPYLELLEGQPGSPWDGHTGSRLDHVSYWVEDIGAESERLEREGFPVFIDGVSAGGAVNFHLLPATRLRLEPAGRAQQEPIRQTWQIEDVEGGWTPGSPWQLGFMVLDIDAARDELSRALGLEWTPVRRCDADELDVCLSLQGPPYFALISASTTSALAWRPRPRLDHLAYWADDLVGEGERLARVGVPMVQRIRPEIQLHHAPHSGVSLKMMDGDYRDVVRDKWGLADVG